MRGSKSRPGRMVGSFLLSALLSAATWLASGTALAQCIFSGTLPPYPASNVVPCFITVQPIDVCGTTGGSCAPFNATSTNGVGIPSTAGAPFSAPTTNFPNGLPVNETSPNPIGFTVDPATGASPPPAGDTKGVDITRTLLNQLGVDLMWLPMATYNSQINTNTNTTFQTLNVTEGATCSGSIAGTTLTIASCSSGVLAKSDSLSGTGITPNTMITMSGASGGVNNPYTGMGGAGTYQVNNSQTVATTTITVTSTLFQSSDFQTLSFQNQIKEGLPTFGINPTTGLPNPNPNYPFQPLGFPSNVINMFFVTTLNPPTPGKLYGLSWKGNNGVAIEQGVFGYPRSRTSPPPRPSTLAHELGHVIGLDHTTFAAGPYTPPNNLTTNPPSYSAPLGVAPPIPTNPLTGECDPSYPACSTNLMTTGSLRSEPTVACVLAGFPGGTGTIPTACKNASGAQLPGLFNPNVTAMTDQVNTPATSALPPQDLPVSQQAQVLTGGSTLLFPFMRSGFLNPIPHETTKAQLGTGGSSTDPVIFDLAGPTGGRPGETLVAWVLTLPQEQTFAGHNRLHVTSQSREGLVQEVNYYPESENNPPMRDIAYYPGADNNPDTPSIGTAADSPCTSATAECLMVKFQPPGLRAHDSISFAKSILSGGAPITNDDLCKAKITYIFSDGYATTSNLGRCPAVSLPLIASSWHPDPHVAPRIIKPNKTNVLLAQLASTATSPAGTVMGSAYFVSEAQAQNAAIPFTPPGPANATFTVPSPTNNACTGTFAGDTLCFNSNSGAVANSYTLGGFLASGGATVLTGSMTDLMRNLDIGTSGTIFEFTGTVTVTNGQTFTVAHDDGLQLKIGDTLVINQPGPTAPVTQTFTYSGPTGNLPFDLVYGECCGAPAVLGISLPLESSAVACLPDPHNPSQCQFTPSESGVSDGNVKEEADQPGQSCNNGTANTGLINGSVTVSAGEQCTYTSPCEITGNLTINGGGVYLDCTVDGNLTDNAGRLVLASSALVHGNVQISGMSTFTLGPGVLINGNLQIKNVPGTEKGTVCGTSVKGNLSANYNAIPLEIGGSNCLVNNIVQRNNISGNLQVNNNTAMTDVSFNTVAGNLQCLGDTALTSGSNTVTGSVQGCHR
jgi:hypothetical protein